MLRSLRFRLPALFLAGIAAAGIVSVAIAFQLLQNYSRSQSLKELRREAGGLNSLIRQQAIFVNDKAPQTNPLDTPQLDLNYGWGDHIQLNLQTSFVVQKRANHGGIGGLGDTEPAVKWRFVDEDRSGAEVADRIRRSDKGESRAKHNIARLYAEQTQAQVNRRRAARKRNRRQTHTLFELLLEGGDVGPDRGNPVGGKCEPDKLRLFGAQMRD